MFKTSKIFKTSNVFKTSKSSQISLPKFHLFRPSTCFQNFLLQLQRFFLFKSAQVAQFPISVQILIKSAQIFKSQMCQNLKSARVAQFSIQILIKYAHSHKSSVLKCLSRFSKWSRNFFTGNQTLMLITCQVLPISSQSRFCRVPHFIIALMCHFGAELLRSLLMPCYELWECSWMRVAVPTIPFMPWLLAPVWLLFLWLCCRRDKLLIWEFRL